VQCQELGADGGTRTRIPKREILSPPFPVCFQCRFRQFRVLSTYGPPSGGVLLSEWETFVKARQGCSPTLVETQDIELVADFWARVRTDANTGCWNWTGAARGGRLKYGMIVRNGHPIAAARFAWMMHHGRDWPARKLALHTCDNSVCVNPEHIEPGTQKKNIADCVARDRHFQASKTHCKSGHDLTGSNLVLKKIARGVTRVCAQCRRDHVKAFYERKRKTDRA